MCYSTKNGYKTLLVLSENVYIDRSMTSKIFDHTFVLRASMSFFFYTLSIVLAAAYFSQTWRIKSRSPANRLQEIVHLNWITTAFPTDQCSM